MKNRKVRLLLCALLAMLMLLPVGCRRAQDQSLPNPDQRQDLDTPDTSLPNPGVVDTAKNAADMATSVQGVDSAVAVVITNMVLVGIRIESNMAEDEENIKEEVARRIRADEPNIATVYVSADPDIFQRLQEISQGIRRGEPITSFFDQLTEVVERMRVETDENNNNNQ